MNDITAEIARPAESQAAAAETLVAVITCRRPAGLERLLRSLMGQRHEQASFRILVVDNACEPLIAELVAVLNAESGVAVEYEQEPEPGIVAARNKCVSLFLASDARHLVFIDDDEWPEKPDWLERLVAAKTRYNADIITSHVLSVGEPGAPEWAVKLIYGDNRLTEGQQVTKFYTNNLLLDRRVLESLKPAFDARFAMTGASDYHFAIRCRTQGFRAHYTNAPVVEEFPASRGTASWFMARGFRSGIGYARTHVFEDGAGKAVALCVGMSVVRCGLGIGTLVLGTLTINRTRVVAGLFRLASATGTIAGLTGVKHEEYRQIHGS